MYLIIAGKDIFKIPVQITSLEKIIILTNIGLIWIFLFLFGRKKLTPAFLEKWWFKKLVETWKSCHIAKKMYYQENTEAEAYVRPCQC